jgi:hypothetical protein
MKVKAFFSKYKLIIPITLSVMIAALLVTQTYMITLFGDEPPEASLPEGHEPTDTTPQITIEAVTQSTTTEAVTQSTTEAVTQSATTEAVTQSTTEVVTQSTSTAQTTITASTVVNDSITAAFTVADSWQDAGRTATRVSQVVITNTGTETLTDWAVTIDVPAGSQIQSGWNADFSVAGDKLTISRGSHGRDIPPGGNYPDVGFIILTDGVFMPYSGLTF